MLSKVLLTPLRRIPTPGGDVRHALKASDLGFEGFGEAYFSSVETGAIKGWKRHRVMTLNLVVAVGEVRFVIHDDQGTSAAYNLSPDQPASYVRLTVPPGLWMAFGGVSSGLNLLLNIADIQHDPNEAETRTIDVLPWTWY